tara:strand:+ start:129 stop:548 length:420 start_codon:yes stop_codon:yes gene_type:complete
MRKLDLNLDENRGELDFNFDNVIGGSLTTPYVPSEYKIGGSLSTPYTPSSTYLGSNPKISLGLMTPETKSIMDSIRDRIKNMEIKKFDPTSSTKTTATPTTTTIIDKGDTKTKKSKMPIALIGGGVVVVGVIMYFIFRK